MKKFIIHTNKYAGNFERNMAAYITGHTGDTSRGMELVENNINYIFKPYIQQIINEKGNKTPVIIYQNPKYSNNGLGYSFDKSNLEECKVAQQKRIDYINENNLKKLYETLDFYNGTKHDVSFIEHQIKTTEAEIQAYSQIPPLEIPTYDAFNSVCIFISDETPNELIELMKERAFMYVKYIEQQITIEGFDLLDDKSDNNTEINDDINNDNIKVKVIAYNGHILIETIDFDVYDKDFTPNGNGRIGCILTNTERLGISNEAFELLSQIKCSHDAIGDFMWDNNSFGWIGGVYAIKNQKAEGDRTFKVQKKFKVIPNDVSSEQMEAVDNLLKPKSIAYTDIKFEPWLEFRSQGDTYHVTMCFHNSHLYDMDNVTGVPENCLKDNGEGDFDVKISDEYCKIICENIYKIFGETYKEPLYDSYIDELFKRFNDNNVRPKHSVSIHINSEDLMDYLNRFFELGFFNNIMYPKMDYWRLTYNATLDDYIKKLEEY